MVRNCNIHFVNKIDSVPKQFFDIIHSFNLDINMDMYTLITHNSRSCIDNVLTDNTGCQAEVIVT